MSTQPGETATWLRFLHTIGGLTEPSSVIGARQRLALGTQHGTEGLPAYCSSVDSTLSSGSPPCVLVESMMGDDDSVFAALTAGARGYLLQGAGTPTSSARSRRTRNGEVLLGRDAFAQVRAPPEMAAEVAAEVSAI